MEHVAKARLQTVISVVLLAGGITLILAFSFPTFAPLLADVATIAFPLAVPALLLVGIVRLRKRRISAGLVSAVLLSTLLFGILAQVATGVSPPEQYYLHDTATSGISPAGEHMNASQGSTEATIAFDTVGQSAYWYVDETWPTGIEDYGLVAGNYTFSMYFAELPQPWWDANYSFRRPVNISAGASSIPANYPVKLTFDHAQLVTDSKSRADGDDIRIVHWTGSAWNELGRVLGNGTSWNSASTTILFKTQAAIAASGTDTDHFLYYNHSTAASPPTNTLSARYFLAESLGETQTSSTSYANKVQLQFTPSDASEHWVIVASWRQRHVGSAGTTVNLGEARITVNGSPRTGTDHITYEMSGDLWNDNGALLKITGATAQQTIGIDFRAVGGTDAIDNARILAFMIPGPTNADIQYGESLTRRNESVNPTDVLTVTFTPSSAGDYVWLANGFHHEGPGSTSTGGLNVVDEAAIEQQDSDETYISLATEGLVPVVHFEQRTLAASSQTFKIRFQPDTTDSEVQGLTMLLFRSDAFEGVETADDASLTTTTSPSYQTKVSLTTATQSSDRDYVYLAVMMHDDIGAGDGLTLGHKAEIRLAGTQQLESYIRIDRGNYDTPMAWGYAETTTGNRALDARFLSEDTSVTAEAQYAHLLALRYKEPALTLDPEETESAGSGSVDITVSVHHTRPDGSDPQEIVISSAVTIDENTTHPFVLNVGTGGAQTFTASDPRRLRLFVNVAAVTGGGRFVLAYNSTGNPTNLETPVTGLRPILFNPTLAPTSGSTTTNFNFTIDYRHTGGTPAGVVRVNVSDAANGTYNNFTMSSTANPDVDYFVQAFQDLTGTTNAFANAQSDSDSGASAVLEQELVITGAVFARPDGDVSNAGGWTPTSLWSRLDETSPDDSGTMVTSGQNPATTETFEVSLTNVVDPQDSTGHIIRFRARGDDGGRDNFLTMRLYQGSTQIASSGERDVTTSWTTFIYTLTAGEANSITDYNNLRLRFIPRTTGTGPGSRVDVTWAELEVPVTETQLLIQFNTTGVRSSGEDTLVLRYNLTSGDDTFGVWVWDFTASDWRNRGTLDQTTASFLNYSLTADEKSGGEVRIRFNDTSSGSTDLSIDYQLVNNQLWKSGVTYYYNTTLAASEYSHFFWANDTADVSNRTATFAGPSVLAPPFLSNFRLEDLLAASRAGEQLDVDARYFFLFNVTDESGWGDIGGNGNVSLRLWYDGTSATSVTTLRAPTVCEAVGNHWTNCLDAFSSNDVYAYANDSGGAVSFDSTSNSSGSGTSLTWSHTTSGTGRLLVVGVSRQPTVTTQTIFSGPVSTTFTVPAGVTSITVKVWGAGGGGGGADAANGGAGGGGGYAYAVISVTPEEVLDIVIGGGGPGGVVSGSGNGGAGGGGGPPVAGGGAGAGATATMGGGGGGGGYAAVIRIGTLLVIGAGGGGGGGGGNTGSEVGGVGGAGGGSTGDNGGLGAALSVATGGTQSAGGSGGTGDTGGDGEDGGLNFGGDGSSIGGTNGGGGGGSGRYGGGGGGGDDDGAGGGGGGSSLGDVLVGGSGTSAGNNSDPDYADSAGQGGAAGAATDGNGGAGNPGRIVISYEQAITTDNVSYNDVFLTQLVNHTEAGDNAQVELWYLLDPDTGAHDVVVNQSAANDIIGGATSWTDVDQATPFGPTAVANGTTDTATVDVTSASNEVVVDVVAALDSASPTVGPGQDERWNLALGALDGGGSTEDGGGTVTMNWTLSGASGWAIAGVSLKGGGAGGGPGKNDSAWKDFGFALGSDTIDTVEVGTEWFRNNTAPILNVTVSWDGGTSWATNQTATNKSGDDNAVEWLDFTAATAWTPTKLNDANLRVRVGTNASGPRLDYVTVRVVSTPSPTTQLDPTACEAVGNNWTTCNDAFSSDNVYAYGNGTAGVGDPITFVDRTKQSTSGTSLSVTVPTHQDGDTLIAVLVHSDDSPAVTITPPAGWNLVRDKTNMGTPATSPPVLYIYERQASSEPASYVWSWDLTGGLLGVMLSYRGTDAASPIGQNAVNAQTGTGANAVAPSVTTTTDNELALWIGWSDDDDSNDPSATLSRGTVRARNMTAAGGNGAFVGIGDENIPSPGTTGTATWTLTASEERSGVTITLLPAPVTGGAANDTAWKDFGFALGSETINTVEVGVEWFRNNTAPSLNVTVSWDGGSTWANNQTATNKSADDDTVEWLSFTTATVWTPTKLNDANLRVRIGTNASGARLDYLTVRVASTSELSYSEQTTGANYRIELKYVDTADSSTASLGEWSVTEGNSVYNASASSLTTIFSGPKLIGYEFKLALKLGFQVRQANDPVNSAVGGYNDLDSWNAEIVVSDGVETTTERTASTGENMEFGVFMYTNVTIGGDWSATGFRGQTVNTNTITVTYRSNDDFNLTIWFTTHLIKGGDTIDISNVQILAAADLNDNITSDTPFVGLGEANLVYILGSASWYFPHATDASENTTVVQFSVFIPGSQAFGTYTAQLVIRIQQKPAS